jgi:hypothetical protein
MVKSTIFATCACIFVATLVRIEAAPRTGAVAAQAEASRVAVNSDDIGGVVTSSKGPEAGVWVIAETTDLPTKFRKIVVTDDAGRYLLPELPKATYKVWVRGYGLVDSKAVAATPGNTLALTAVIAPNARAAAQYYPGDYWFSLVKMPPKSAFPLKIRTGGEDGDKGQSVSGGGGFGPPTDKEVYSQAEWSYLLKRGCEVCHQMGDKATREIEPSLGTFDSPSLAWERRLMSGQVGPDMTNGLNNFGHDRGLAMFADWSTRIAAGEVPPAPPRPQGIERNVVITLWDFGTDRSFVHDVISTDERNPTTNAYGPIYGPDFSAGAIAVLDPAKNTKSMVRVPLRNENDRKLLRPWSSPNVAAPSPYWGNEIVWNDPVNPSGPHLDSKGRLWFHAQTRTDLPDYCKEGSANPFAKNFPIPAGSVTRGGLNYDSKTGKFEMIDLCLSSGHMIFAKDKDETLYYNITSGVKDMGAIGWIKTRVWDETHDAEKSQGWCPAVIDYNGDGKTGAYTKPNEPPDPKLDRAVSGASGYGIAINPADGSVWYAGTGRSWVWPQDQNRAASARRDVQPITYGRNIPGRIIRMVPGANPPATCMTEAYEPPFDNPKLPGVEAYSVLGIGIDSNGVVWTALAGSNDLASFDRRKCKGPLNGPTATGQHCPEGWTLYPVPGPKFKGTSVLADSFYHNWVDDFNTLGLGKDVPIVNGTGSDSLIALLPETKKFVTMRLPYPMGFYTRSVGGRIDDPKAGWKGRGLWVGNEERVVWHVEGGKGTTTFVAHFQIRPDPLAK